MSSHRRRALALQQLAAYIEKIPYFQLVAECPNAIEAKEIMENDIIDAIFVDINMPDLNGMDFVKSLAAPPIVVFTTAYSEYAVDGFKAGALNYLLKPFGLDDFRQCAERVKHQYELENAQASSVSSPDEDDALFLKTEHRVVRIKMSDIKYVEGMSEYLKIHFDNQKPLIVLLSMKKLEERLPQHFMRIHRSYIINLRKIQEVNKNRVIMNTDTYLPIGDLYRDVFNNYINSKFLGK